MKPLDLADAEATLSGVELSVEFHEDMTVAGSPIQEAIITEIATLFNIRKTRIKVCQNQKERACYLKKPL